MYILIFNAKVILFMSIFPVPVYVSSVFYNKFDLFGPSSSFSLKNLVMFFDLSA